MESNLATDYPPTRVESAETTRMPLNNHKAWDAGCDACADRFSCSWRLVDEEGPPSVPWQVWCAVAVLGLDTLLGLFVMLGRPDMMVGGAIAMFNAVFILGLVRGDRWAFIGATLFAVFQFLFNSVVRENVFALALDVAFLISVAGAFRYFYPPKQTHARNLPSHNHRKKE